MKSGLKCISSQGKIRVRVYFRVQNQMDPFSLLIVMFYPKIVCFGPESSALAQGTSALTL